MMNRDEYVQKLKTQIDAWNNEAGRWEERVRKAQAGMKAEYERQLQNFRRKSDEATAELRRLQSASVDAWTEMMRGAEASMMGMQEAFEKARRSFDKDKNKK
jgi:lipid II:glycine glycyltransferase (peptidoglycan interpeptide bridge formation enzyme)